MEWVLVIFTAANISTQQYFPSWEKCAVALQKVAVPKQARMAYCRKVYESTKTG